MSTTSKLKHIVGFSGGIDSQACLRWVRQHCGDENTIALNSTVGGNESAITEEFIRQYSLEVFPVTRVSPLVKDIWRTEGYAETKGLDGNAELSFLDMALIKGRWPSKTAQFCSEIMKVYPSLRWQNETFGVGGEFEGYDYERYVGVRADESAERSKYPDIEFDKTFDCWLHRPLLTWNKLQCFAYVKSFGEPVNPLYTKGFARVGCAPCINSNKQDIRNWQLQEPAMLEKIDQWEKQSGRTFFPPGIVPGKHIVQVNEVITWSMTKRGGKEPDFTILDNPRQVCTSKYGLCE